MLQEIFIIVTTLSQTYPYLFTWTLPFVSLCARAHTRPKQCANKQCTLDSTYTWKSTQCTHTLVIQVLVLNKKHCARYAKLI